MPDRWRIEPGDSVRLSELSTDSTAGAPGDRTTTEAAFEGLHAELAGFQERLWAEGRRAVLVVLQAMDAGGKDGTIKHVFGGVNPQGTRVTSFKVPTTLESRHDFLWRIHQAVPAHGEIGIFNRSHYEDVLAVRVHQLVSEKVWRARYDLINSFEEVLHHGGTTVVKLFLHISKAEQQRRLEERDTDPHKQWKRAPRDWEERRYWDDYQSAYEELLNRTSTTHAPWYVIPADHKWYRNWAVSRILIETLRRLDPRYPASTGSMPNASNTA